VGEASEWNDGGVGSAASGSRGGAKWRTWRRDPPGGGDDLFYLNIPWERRTGDEAAKNGGDGDDGDAAEAVLATAGISHKGN
jgi:hypothetical protein